MMSTTPSPRAARRRPVPSRPSSGRANPLIRQGLLIGLVSAVLLVAIGPGDSWLATAFALAGDSGTAGIAIFILLFIVATLVLVPGSILTLVAGFLFGVAKGFAVVTVASLLAALVTLAVGRYLAQDFVDRRLAARPRLHLLVQAIEANGLRAVLLARLVPFIPYNLLNYALSLTHVRWRPYALGTLLGMIPGSLALVYIGAATSDLNRAMTGATALNGAGWPEYLLAAVAILISSWWLSRRATRELNAMMGRLKPQNKSTQ